MQKRDAETTYRMAMSAGRDAANRQMKAAGRTAWTEEDYATATRETNRLLSAVE